MTTFTGTSGNDNFTGTSGDDLFEMDQKGNDTIDGGDGDDQIEFGGRFSELDTVNGGTGNDTLVMDGDYSDGLDLKPTTLTSVENIDLFGTSHVALFMKDKNVAAGDTLTINASRLAGQPNFGDSLYLDASAETDGFYHIIGTDGNDEFHMGASFKRGYHIDGNGGNDQLFISGADLDMHLSAKTMTDILVLGTDRIHNYHFVADDGVVQAGDIMFISAENKAHKTFYWDGSRETDGAYEFDDGGAGQAILKGGAGDDNFSGGVKSIDRLYGGAGDDTFAWGDIEANVSTIHLHKELNGIDTVEFANAQSLHLVLGRGIEDPGKALVFDVSHYHQTLDFNDSHDHIGSLDFIGQGVAARLTVVGTGQADTFDLTAGETVASNRATLTGGGGADLFKAVPGGLERFVYTAASDSTSTGYDTIQNAGFANERFITHAIGPIVSGVDTAVTAGALSTASFDSDLAAAVGAGQMAAHHAVLFTADAGTLSGHTFLVIDENGTAGYQASADLVIDVTGATGTLSTLNFA